MNMTRILVFAGSIRRESLNRRLAAIAAEMAREQGAVVTPLELRDFPMPLYNGDIEETDGLPNGAARLSDTMKEHDGLLLACPEYNSSIAPLLKNAIDWVSRPSVGEPPLAAFTGKVAGLLSASPGQLGGMRGLAHVRSILSNIGVHVIPAEAAVSAAHQAFAADGTLQDERTSARVADVVKQLVATTARLRRR